jgi:hypothetical protein
MKAIPGCVVVRNSYHCVVGLMSMSQLKAAATTTTKIRMTMRKATTNQLTN